MIDTENYNADLYAHLGDYSLLQLFKYFFSERYIDAIGTYGNGGMEVIDSITREWKGSEGILDVHGNMLGNSFTNWAKMTAGHNAFVQKILESHVILFQPSGQRQIIRYLKRTGKWFLEKVGLFLFSATVSLPYSI